MAQAGFTPISLYFSSTAAAVPTSANLANGELALNIADMKLYAKNSAGVVTLLASNASTTGVDSLSFGSTGLTPSTATTGAITVAGTLNVANGGTGLTTLTAGRIPFGAGTSAFGNSTNLFWDSANERLGIGTSSPAKRLQSTDSNGDVLRLQRSGAFTGLWDVKIGSVVTGDFTLTDAENSVSPIVIEKGASIANAIYVKNTGNVGIGNVTPPQKLSIAGAIAATSNSGTANTNYATFGLYTGGPIPITYIQMPVGGATDFWRPDTGTIFRMGTAGQFGVGTNYGTAGQVLTSGGSGAAPTWAAAGGGSQAFVAFGTTGGR